MVYCLIYQKPIYWYVQISNMHNLFLAIKNQQISIYKILVKIVYTCFTISSGLILFQEENKRKNAIFINILYKYNSSFQVVYEEEGDDFSNVAVSENKAPICSLQSSSRCQYLTFLLDAQMLNVFFSKRGINISCLLTSENILALVFSLLMLI